MSVDFYHCDCCDESRYQEFVGYCSKCGHSLCTDCLVNDDIDSNYAYDYQVRFHGSPEQMKEYRIDNADEYEIGDKIDDSGIESKYCPFCNDLKIHDNELLEYAMELLKTTKDKLKDEYRIRRFNK